MQALRGTEEFYETRIDKNNCGSKNESRYMNTATENKWIDFISFILARKTSDSRGQVKVCS
jgi:hypothetical protein